MTGLDAVEFIDKWAETFDIKVDHLPYSRYSGPDSMDVIREVLSLFLLTRADSTSLPSQSRLLCVLFGCPSPLAHRLNHHF